MTMIALCAAQLFADDVDAWGMPVLRALLPIAGMTVIEQQAERARAAGIAKILILVDTVPSGLADACDRIRSRGLAVELVRSPQDVIDQADGADRLTLVADGLIAGPEAWQWLGQPGAPCVLVTVDTPMTEGLERIDSATRWAGLAIVDHAMLAGLNQAPADWDPQLVLLRNAMQQGVQRISCSPSLFVSGDIAMADTPVEAAEAEQRLLSTHAAKDHGLVGRWIIGPMIRVVAGPLLARQTSGKIARVLTPLLAISAAVAALMTQVMAMTLLGLVAAIAHQAAGFIASFRPESRLWRWVGTAGLWLQLGALIIADRHLQLGEGGGGYWPGLGEGGMAASLVVIISLLLGRSAILRLGYVLDLPMVWILAGFIVPAMGWRAGFDAIGILAGIILAVAVALARLPANAHDSDAV